MYHRSWWVELKKWSFWLSFRLDYIRSRVVSPIKQITQKRTRINQKNLKCINRSFHDLYLVFRPLLHSVCGIIFVRYIINLVNSSESNFHNSLHLIEFMTWHHATQENIAKEGTTIHHDLTKNHFALLNFGTYSIKMGLEWIFVMKFMCSPRFCILITIHLILCTLSRLYHITKNTGGPMVSF